MRKNLWCFVVLLSAALVLPGTALAQTGGISGEVVDETGGVLPGVTATATSPGVIDVRTAVTGGDGRYTFVGLTPGIYLVEFTLPGFSTVRREGIELSAGFTANIDIQMVVGGVEETVTVTGATPTVDIQNVRTQNTLSDETLDLLPNAQTVSSFAALTLGARLTGNAGNGGVDVGGTGGEMGTASIHNNRQGDMKISQDGMNTNNSMGTNGGILHMGQHYNMEGVAEVSMSHNGMTADTETAGLQLNYIPKEGGNQFSASGRSTFTNGDFQADNLSSDLEARGAVTPPEVRKVYDYGASFGGPIKRDTLWFFTAHRWWGASTYTPGAFFNASQGQRDANGRPFYTPGARGFNDDPSQENSFRLTWQASSKDKITWFGNHGDQCLCGRAVSAVLAPEAALNASAPTNHLQQGTWTRAHSNSILIEAGYSWLRNPFTFGITGDVKPDDIQIFELATFDIFNAWAAATIPYNASDPSATDQVNARAAISYVTGSHSFKFGTNWAHGWIEQTGSNNVLPGFGPVAQIRVIDGVPNRITIHNHPNFNRSDFQNLGFYAQDQWTLNRVTINLGVRADFFNGFTPAQTVPDTVYVPGFDVARLERTPDWQDVSPRLGVAWDITGDGKTAFKMAAGKYMAGQGTGLPVSVNPANAIAKTTTRSWADANNNFFPEGDPSNPLANGELGPSSNPLFGTSQISRFFADDYMLENRPYTWQFSAGVDRELQDNVRVSLTYFRTSHYNQIFTDNTGVTSANYDPFCVTAPSDSRLGSASASEICGLANISTAGLAASGQRLTQNDKNFGDQTEVFNGVDVETQARFDNGALFQGGVTFGETVNNECFVVDSPQDLYQCEVATPWWSGNGQIKLAGSYPLPYGIELSGVYQNISSAPIQAAVTFPNAQVAPSLGRNLSSCPAATGACNSTVMVNVLEPNGAYEDRTSQLDFRVAKVFTGGFGMVRVTMDLYNAFNSAPILTRSNGYGIAGAGGAAWGTPTSIMTGRLVKLGAQFNWN